MDERTTVVHSKKRTLDRRVDRLARVRDPDPSAAVPRDRVRVPVLLLVQRHDHAAPVGSGAPAGALPRLEPRPASGEPTGAMMMSAPLELVLLMVEACVVVVGREGECVRTVTDEEHSQG